MGTILKRILDNENCHNLIIAADFPLAVFVFKEFSAFFSIKKQSFYHIFLCTKVCLDLRIYKIYFKKEICVNTGDDA